MRMITRISGFSDRRPRAPRDGVMPRGQLPASCALHHGYPAASCQACAVGKVRVQRTTPPVPFVSAPRVSRR